MRTASRCPTPTILVTLSLQIAAASMRRLHVEVCLGGVQLRGGGVRAQSEAARPQSMLTAIQTGFTRHGPIHAHAGSGPHPPAHALRDRRDHRVVAGLGELEALRVRPADHDERRARREVVLERRVAGVHLAEVAARRVAGLVEREEVAAPAGSAPRTRPEAEVVGWEAVVRLAVERVAHQRLRVCRRRPCPRSASACTPRAVPRPRCPTPRRSRSRPGPPRPCSSPASRCRCRPPRAPGRKSNPRPATRW